jgi:hypothetical protein
MLIQYMTFVVVFELHRTYSHSLSGCIGHGFPLVHASSSTRPNGRAASAPWSWRDYIKGPQTFHSHFLHRLGLENPWCV